MPLPMYSRGQSVQYKPVGGPDSQTSKSIGTITNVSTQPDTQADRHVQASPEKPRYEIENKNTGKMTSVYEQNILGAA